MSTQHRSAERRAHLFREMSREIQRPNSRTSSHLSRSSRSASSVADNTLTSEEQEQFLPALVAPHTPPKAPQQNQDQQIHTSAARRAFPGFSDPGSPESPSIEHGRGGVESGQSSPSNLSGSTDPSESFRFEMPDGEMYRFNWEKYNEMLGRKKQPKSRKQTSINSTATSKGRAKSSATMDAPLDKENQDPAKTTRYGSSRSTSDEGKDNRSKQSEMKATVESDDESNRQATATFPRSTKTYNIKSGTNVTPKAQQTPHHIIPSATFTATSFNGSVALPDVPNITELITGQNLDGTPIYPRTAKILAKHGIAPSGRNALHHEIEGVEIPTDEKALYTSLAVLQRKVDELELEREKYDKNMDAKDKELKEIESKVRRLNLRLEEQERLGRKDSGIDVRVSKTSNWEEERVEFEQTVKTLESRLHKANERTLQNELTISKLINDKQTADQQLVDANVNVKELTEESNSIHANLVQTRKDFEKQTHQYEEKMNRLVQQDEELRGKIQRRQKAVDQMSVLARELYETRQQVSNRIATDSSERTSTENVYKSKQRSKSAERRVVEHSQRTADEIEPVPGIRLSKRHSVGGIPPRPANPEPASSAHERDFSKDSDFLSFMEGDEVAKLRDIVERDRAVLAEQQQEQRNHVEEDDLTRSTGFDDVAGSSTRRMRRQARAREREQQLAEAREHVIRESRNKIIDRSRNESMPLKPSLKKQSQQFQEEEEDAISTRSTGNSRQQVIREDRPLTVDLTDMKEDTQTSIATSNRHRSRHVEDETSQLFLDDITMSTNQFGLASLPRRTHMIPRAVPASEEDPSSKASRPPGVSLAIVLQGFKDELVRMEECKARYEAKLNEKKNLLTRPALAECRLISFKITQLIDAIHVRSYHISNLYNVLEGQKEADQLMEEDEIEVTLQSLGIHPVEWEGLSD